MNLLKLLKRIAPDLAPLLGYVIADLLFGKSVSFYVGTGLGALGFICRLIVDRKADWFLLADTVALGLLGGISLIFHSELFMRLKPAIIEGVFAIGLLIVILLPAKTLKSWVTRLMNGYPLDDNAMSSLRRSLRLMAAVFFIHMALTVWAAFEASTPVWRFVSGGLLYIMFGFGLLLEWLSARRKTPNPDDSAPKGQLLKWSLLIMNDSGGIFAAKVDRDAAGNPLWDTPVRGIAGSSAELSRQVDQGLGRLGLDPAAVRARTGRALSIQPLFLIAESQAARLPQEEQFSLDALFSQPAQVQAGERELVLAAVLGMEAFPKGNDPTERRFWSMQELDALAAGSRKISLHLLNELQMLSGTGSAPHPGSFTASHTESIVTEENHAIS